MAKGGPPLKWKKVFSSAGIAFTGEVLRYLATNSQAHCLTHSLAHLCTYAGEWQDRGWTDNNLQLSDQQCRPGPGWQVYLGGWCTNEGTQDQTWHPFVSLWGSDICHFTWYRFLQSFLKGLEHHEVKRSSTNWKQGTKAFQGYSKPRYVSKVNCNQFTEDVHLLWVVCTQLEICLGTLYLHSYHCATYWCCEETWLIGCFLDQGDQQPLSCCHLKLVVPRRSLRSLSQFTNNSRRSSKLTKLRRREVSSMTHIRMKPSKHFLFLP